LKQVLGFVFALGVTLTVAIVGAQSKPNFSGDWQMNIVKSDFGAAPAPDTMTRKIVHAEPALSIDEEQATPIGPQRTTRKYVTDGTESSFNVGGTDVRTAAKWEGNVLVAVTTVDVAGLVYNDRMTLSGDGKTLTSVVKLTTPQGPIDITVVFEKQ
jgi:hypothetical protein